MTHDADEWLGAVGDGVGVGEMLYCDCDRM